MKILRTQLIEIKELGKIQLPKEVVVNIHDDGHDYNYLRLHLSIPAIFKSMFDLKGIVDEISKVAKIFIECIDIESGDANIYFQKKVLITNTYRNLFKFYQSVESDIKEFNNRQSAIEYLNDIDNFDA